MPGIESSASNSGDWVSFWARLDDSSATTSHTWWGHLSYLNFLWEAKYYKDEITATDLSIHGRIRGKLRPPKLQLPRGYGNRVKTQRHEYSGPHYK